MNKEEVGHIIIRHITIILIIVSIILLSGTFYYYYFEGLTFLEAFFFTAITISTVGYEMPQNLSQFGRIFTSFLIFGGISVVLYGVSSITAIVVEGQLRDYMARRKMKKMLEKLTDHIIVVGAGKTGQYVISELLKEREKFVVIDTNEELLKRLTEIYKVEIPYVIGDATEEDILISAGIERAKALITTLPEDSVNVFVVLSARTLNATMTIVSKVSDVSSIRKLIYAGATTVVAAAEIAGTRMARLTTRPETVNFLDIVAFGNESYRIEEVLIPSNSPYVNKTLAELELARKYNVMVVAIQRSEDILFAPTGKTTIHPDDKLMVLGKKENVESFREAGKV
ncbi:potassium channel protein [Thermosipho ferrireducens]|uniref:Potassium channel protein n=1 Tax=Thermosipho ferrireducens TaxID=2571116 RepID=A0ABX7S8A9_9BACT|nr:potassium channel protein [Thermosipho ferrireducens]QTA37518.1 potassium channel protein [Thermosipho ferrireducens]